MEIVYFLPDIEAGVSRVVRNLLQYRPASDFSYKVVLMHSKGSNEKRITEAFNCKNTIRFIYDPLDNIYCVYKQMAALLNTDDVVVGNDGYEIRMVVALKLKNPVVYILHGDFKYYYLICKLNQLVIDQFIAISSKISNELKIVLHEANKDKIELIYYPSAAIGNAQVVKNKSHKFKIVFAGNLSERKGAHLLPDIYDKMNEAMPDFILEIIGDGEFYKQLAAHFKNSGNVILSGWKSNEYVMKSMAESHVFLFPSLLEGLPNVLIEALSVGAVPVSSDLDSGIPDIIENERNGILVEIGNADAFALAIIALYQKPERLSRLRSFGIEVLARFEPKQQAKLYHNSIVLAAQNSALKVRKFPVYPMGGILNKPWIPNGLVHMIRRHIKHPKL